MDISIEVAHSSYYFIELLRA